MIDTTSPLVLAGDWSVSYAAPAPCWSTDSARAQQVAEIAAGRAVTQRVHRYHADQPNEFGGRGTIEHHPEHHGRTFPDLSTAQAHAVEQGLLVPYKPTLAEG